MSRIEELIYSAYEHGQRTQLLETVSKIRISNPKIPLEDVYDMAYSEVMKTK